MFSSCVSTKTLKERDQEIMALREQRTNLKKELRATLDEMGSLEVALAEASARLNQAPEPMPANPNRFDDINKLGIDTMQRGSDLVISIPSSITFGSGQAALTTQGKQAMRAVAQTLEREYPSAEYWIEGHTDSDPISKSKFGSNRELSIARAMAVLHYLVEDCGTPDSQCVVGGHGEYRPIASNNSKSEKARNRRVEIVVHKAN